MTIQPDIAQIGATPVPFSRRFSFHSRIVEADFIIDVALPAPYLPGDEPWPVLLMTDGNMAFPTTAATAGILPVEPGGPRPVCVVGIGYALGGEGEDGEHFVLRNRDLSPVRVKEWEMRMRAAPPPFGFGEELQTGGGDKFLDFLSEELSPWLAENFPVNIKDCTLSGSSLGGTLVLHAMFKRPGAFTRHMAISPSLWWAKQYLFELEASYAAANADLCTQLYLCIGGAEEAQAPEARMVSNFVEFAARLEQRGYKSLHLKHEILAGETHVSVFNAAISNGLRNLFGARDYHA